MAGELVLAKDIRAGSMESEKQEMKWATQTNLGQEKICEHQLVDIESLHQLYFNKHPVYIHLKQAVYLDMYTQQHQGCRCKRIKWHTPTHTHTHTHTHTREPTYHSSLHDIGYHDNDVYILFPRHLPKVHCGVRQWTLGCNVLLWTVVALHIDWGWEVEVCRCLCLCRCVYSLYIKNNVLKL